MENVAVQSGISSSVEIRRPFIPCYAATRGTFAIIVAHIDQFRFALIALHPSYSILRKTKTNHDSDDSQTCHII